MAVNINVRRLAQQKTRVTEVHLSPLPAPPAALLKFPGVSDWWIEMLKVRERDQQTLYQALLTKATGDEDDQGGDGGGTGGSVPACCDELEAALAETNTRIDNLIGDDTLAWLNL